MNGRRRILWAQLRIGLVASLVALAGALVTFFIDNVTEALQGRYTLYFRTATTQTIRPRTPVWLAGQPVGHVSRLRFEPAARPTPERLRVELSVSTSARPLITEGAAAQVITAGLLGEAVVNIIPARTPGEPLAEGSELPRARELDPFRVTRRLEVLRDSVPPVVERWRLVFRELDAGRGTLGRLLKRRDEFVRLARNVDAVSAVFDTMGMAADRLSAVFTDREVRAALDRLAPRLRRLAEVWSAGGGGSVGALARDTTLAVHLDALAARLARLNARLDSAHGTLGRLLRDRALARELAETRGMLHELRSGLVPGGGR